MHIRIQVYILSIQNNINKNESCYRKGYIHNIEILEFFGDTIIQVGIISYIYSRGSLVSMSMTPRKCSSLLLQ